MTIRTRATAAVAALLAAAAVVPSLADAARSPKPRKANPYALVHRCYALRSLPAKAFVARVGAGYAASARKPSGAARFRMQATGLGRYMLVGPDMARPAASAGGGDVSASQALDDSAVWRVRGVSRSAFTLSSPSTHRLLAVAAGARRLVTEAPGAPKARARFTFTRAKRCATPPEAQVGAAGRSFRGASATASVRGTIDAHTHVTAFEFIGGDFHCGRPWDPFGVTVALPDCASIQGPQGSAAPVQNFLDYGAPEHPHDTVGWPTFHDWPGPTRLSYEGTYYTGLKRAWLAGLRLMVTDLVDNEALCSIMSMRRNPCNDMASVHIQARDLHALQDYVDAQSGGPGKGWLRIVTNPFQARRAINAGKMGVVEGIEVSRVFGCGEQNHVSQCNQADVDRGMSEVRRLGVSSFYPVHKFDNAFGGTKMDGGAVGVVVNGGNHLETGHFWDVHTCTGKEHDSQQLTPADLGGSGPSLPGSPFRMVATPALGLAGTPLGDLVPGGAVPVYPPAPHCNAQGLTDLGAYLIRRMIDRHFLIEIDHMDAKTGDKALNLIESRHYSGVVSPHNWSSPEQYPRIYRAGGFITPIAGSSPESFVAQWRADKKLRDGRYRFGFGYGSDMNGLADQSAPTVQHPIAYPFRSSDGRVSFARERWGQRTFDVNHDGVANYGMYADWLEELRILGGPPLMTDMFNGAEAYLETWERAYGVPATRCLPGGAPLSARGLGTRLRLGASAPALLRAAGQPSSRPGRSYRYCQAGGGRAAVVFSRGRAVLVSSTAPAALGGRATRARTGLVQGHASGGARFVYRVASGRLRWAAVAAASEPPARLRADIRAAGLR